MTCDVNNNKYVIQSFNVSGIIFARRPSWLTVPEDHCGESMQMYQND